jgi:SHS2 domain-containing protein
MPHRVLDHTADTGIEATADTFSELLRELAVGMFGLVARVPPSAVQRWVRVTVTSPTVQDLVVDSLSKLLFLSEVENLLFGDFRVTIGEGEGSANLEAGGVPTPSVEAAGPPIKAVTYHGLLVERREREWYGRVYFDV